jgi:hypothetical protein
MFLSFLRVALPLVIWVMPIKAEDSPWKQLQSAIEEFFSQSRYAEAQSTFQRALGEIEKGEESLPAPCGQWPVLPVEVFEPPLFSSTPALTR